MESFECLKKALPYLLMCCFVFMNLTGCFDSNNEESIVENSDADVIVTEKAITKTKDGSFEETIVLSFDCRDSVYAEVVEDIEQLKKENELLSSIKVSNVQSDNLTERIIFDLEITDEQIIILAAESEEVSSTDTDDKVNKGWPSLPSKEKYCIRSNWKNITCSTDNNLWYDEERKTIKTYNLALASVAAVARYGKGCSAKKGKCKAYCK